MFLVVVRQIYHFASPDSRSLFFSDNGTLCCINEIVFLFGVEYNNQKLILK